MNPAAAALLAIAAAVPPPTATTGDPWPSFRGAGARGVADGPAPTRWDAPKGQNLLWKTPIPGLAVSSPVVWGDRVFVTTAVSGDPKATLRTGLYGDVAPEADVSRHVWKVLALELQTGRVVWERVAHEGIPRTKRHPKSSQATPSPATDGRHVAVFFGSHGLHLYDVDGTLLWKKDLGVLNAGWFFDPDYEWGVGSSPVIHGDRVFVQCDVQRDSFIAAFALADGKELWRTPREEIPSWATPTIVESDGRTELVTNATGFVRAYDPSTGKELWRMPGGSEIAVPTPFAAHGLIFAFGGYGDLKPMMALRPGGQGNIAPRDRDTSGPFVAWSRPQGGPYLPTPVVYGDHLYIVQNNGVLSAWDARKGERLYQERLGGGGAFTASLVAADGKIYCASEDGDVFVVQAGPAFALLATNPVGEPILATPALSRGILLVRGMGHLFAFREDAPDSPAGGKE